MWKIKSLATWLKKNKFGAVLLAFSQSSSHAIFRILWGARRRHARHRPIKFKPYHLSVEELEIRLLPSTMHFTTASYSVSENAGFSAVVVTRDDTAGSASAMISATAGTANSSNYSLMTQLVHFSAGQSSATVDVQIYDDHLATATKNFTLNLSTPSTGDDIDANRSSMTVNIQDSDADYNQVLWTGGGNDGQWANPLNWSNGAAPGSNDDVIINATGITVQDTLDATTIHSLRSSANLLFDHAVSLVATSSMTGTATFNEALDLQAGASLSLAAGGAFNSQVSMAVNSALNFQGGTFVLNPGASLTGAGTLQVNNNAVLDLEGDATVHNASLSAGGTIRGTGTLTITGAMDWTGGTMTDAGMTRIAAGGTLNLTDTNNYGYGRYLQGGRTLENHGTIVWAGSQGITDNSGSATLDNFGLIDIQGDGTLSHYASYYSAPSTFTVQNESTGTIQKSGASNNPYYSTTFSDVSLNNDGAVDAQTGTLRLAGGGTGTGTFVAESGATLEFGGSTYVLLSDSATSGAGTIKVSAGTVTAAGSYSVGNTVITGGTFNVTSNGTTVNGQMSGGTLGGAGTFTITGVFGWTGGTMTDAGVTMIAVGATLSLTDGYNYYGSSRSLQGGRTLENHGAIVWAGSQGINDNSGNAILDNYGLIDIQGDGTLSHYASYYSAPSTFTVQNESTGTIQKSGASNNLYYSYYATVFSDVILNNDGLVDVQAGSLRLAGGGTLGGTVTVAANSELTFQSAPYTLADGLALSGAGTYRINASVSVAGSVSVTHLVLESGGTIAGMGTLTVSGSLGWTGGTMTDAGVTMIAVGATLSLTDGNGYYGSSRSLQGGRTLENHGAIVWAGTQGISDYSGNATLVNYGLFDIQGDGTLSHYASYWGTPSTFIVHNEITGTIQKSGASNNSYYSTTFSDVILNNDGTVDVQTGTLRLAGGGSGTGTFAAENGATLEFGGGTYALSSASATSGAGTIKVSSGTVNEAGNYTVDNTSITGGILDFLSNGNTVNGQMSGGTLGGTGIFTITGTFGWTGGTMTDAGVTMIAVGATLSLTDGMGTMGPAVPCRGDARWRTTAPSSGPAARASPTTAAMRLWLTTACSTSRATARFRITLPITALPPPSSSITKSPARSRSRAPATICITRITPRSLAM